MVQSSTNVALDSNVLFDLAAGEDFALTALEVLQKQGASLHIPPTVIFELAFEIKNGPSPKKVAQATRAMQNLQTWKIEVMKLTPKKLEDAREFSNAIRQAGLLDPKERHDGDILGEATQHRVEFLLTSDKHLLGIDRDKLHAFYRTRGVAKVEVVSPWRFFTALYKRR